MGIRKPFVWTALSTVPLTLTLFCTGLNVGSIFNRSSGAAVNGSRAVKTEDITPTPEGVYYQCDKFKELTLESGTYALPLNGKGEDSAGIGRELRAMRLSDAGVRAIACHEDFIPEVYLDAANLPTIGYGHLITEQDFVEAGLPVPEQITLQEARKVFPFGMTEAEGMEYLRQEIGQAEEAVNRSVRVPMTQPQFDALVSFTYNVGVNGFEESTLLTHLNNGHEDAAAKEFRKWVYVTRHGYLRYCAGLHNRRRAEETLFRSGIVKAEKIHLSRREMPSAPIMVN